MFEDEFFYAGYGGIKEALTSAIFFSDLANFTYNINITFQCRFLTYMLASIKHIKTFHYKVVMSYMLETMI